MPIYSHGRSSAATEGQMRSWAGSRVQNIVFGAIDQWRKRLDPVFVRRISNNCSDIACREFYDCIKHVESVDPCSLMQMNWIEFLTSSYCCKLLELGYCISRGNVVTVLRRGGQNFKYLQQRFLKTFCQILLKSVDWWRSYSTNWRFLIQ